MLKFEELQVGQFYIPLFERIEHLDTFGNELDQYNFGSPFYQYVGNGQFLDEYGDTVYSFYDPELGLDVAVNAADGFAQ